MALSDDLDKFFGGNPPDNPDDGDGGGDDGDDGSSGSSEEDENKTPAKMSFLDRNLATPLRWLGGYTITVYRGKKPEDMVYQVTIDDTTIAVPTIQELGKALTWKG